MIGMQDMGQMLPLSAAELRLKAGLESAIKLSAQRGRIKNLSKAIRRYFMETGSVVSLPDGRRAFRSKIGRLMADPEGLALGLAARAGVLADADLTTAVDRALRSTPATPISASPPPPGSLMAEEFAGQIGAPVDEVERLVLLADTLRLPMHEVVSGAVTGVFSPLRLIPPRTQTSLQRLYTNKPHSIRQADAEAVGLLTVPQIAEFLRISTSAVRAVICASGFDYPVAGHCVPLVEGGWAYSITVVAAVAEVYGVDPAEAPQRRQRQT